MNKWRVCYKKAKEKDGSLLFPERLSHEVLENLRKVQGSYIFANQYLNEIIPEDTAVFKLPWIKYYETLPSVRLNTFAFFDPAISQEKHADYTGVSVVHVDSDANRYLAFAGRFKLTPTELINMMFKIHSQFRPMAIGLETIAFQEALLYMLDIEMRKRGVILPVKGIGSGSTERKEMRISSLVPYFEWGRYFIKKGLTDFEDELLTFPRGAHDDIIDSVASLEKIIVAPEKEKLHDRQPNPADAQDYESWYRRQLAQKGGPRQTAQDDDY